MGGDIFVSFDRDAARHVTATGAAVSADSGLFIAMPSRELAPLAAYRVDRRSSCRRGTPRVRS